MKIIFFYFFSSKRKICLKKKTSQKSKIKKNKEIEINWRQYILYNQNK